MDIYVEKNFQSFEKKGIIKIQQRKMQVKILQWKLKDLKS
jgi:hypothetical protein